MKRHILIVFLLMGIFAGCQKDHQMNKEQLKKAFVACLNDTDLKGRMYSDSLTNDKRRLYLHGNVSIGDSIQIGKRIYLFKAPRNVQNDSVCQFKLTYKSKDVANLYLLYRIGHNSKIYSDCDYKYANGEWRLINQNNGILDGKNF